MHDGYVGPNGRARVEETDLIVVSNREPYIHRRTSQGIQVERASGGLSAALESCLAGRRGRWIAWGEGDADFDVTNDEGVATLQVPAANVTLERLRLSPDEIEGYYHGYANQVLWPLCHSRPDKMRFNQVFWAHYAEVNRRFALRVLERAPRGAIVWWHDYHLALSPRYLRRRRPDLTLMHFWHIPWPNWDVFRMLPERKAILVGLLANDLIGFQTSRHVENFLDCIDRELHADIDAERGAIAWNGRLSTAQAFPISVDFKALNELARSDECATWMRRLRTEFRLGKGQVVASVDRLDYTKGILERLRAIETLLVQSPSHRGRVTFFQKVAPSRSGISGYRAFRARVEAEVERLNATYAEGSWRPIVYVPDPWPVAAVTALYRLADVCVVSSLEDGMNLVAKEFLACHVDKGGKLVLSELTGAFAELPRGLSVNPYDAWSFARVLDEALDPAETEGARRTAMQRAYVAEHDLDRWISEQIELVRRLTVLRLTNGTSRAAATLVSDHRAQPRGA